MSRESVWINTKIRVIIFAVIITALGLTVYRTILSDLISCVLHREGSSHGVFVPFISAFFLWQNWGKIKDLEVKFALVPGIVTICISLVILYLSKNSADISIAALSYFMAVTGLVLALFGTRIFKGVSFPILFLIMMIPLPKTVYSQIAEWMRASGTYGSSHILEFLGIPYYREGYDIHLANTKLYVAHGCSGIRYLLSYFVFGVAYAYIFKDSIRSRILVLLLIIPISVLAGVLRLTTIFLSAYFIGAFMADHGPHIRISWLVFAVVLVVGIFIDRKWFNAQQDK
jgi:exosortase